MAAENNSGLTLKNAQRRPGAAAEARRLVDAVARDTRERHDASQSWVRDVVGGHHRVVSR
jgi:hypothetical protein